MKVDQEGEFRLAPLKRVGTKTQQENRRLKTAAPKSIIQTSTPSRFILLSFTRRKKVDAEMKAEEIHCNEVYSILANDSKGGQTGRGAKGAGISVESRLVKIRRY